MPLVELQSRGMKLHFKGLSDHLEKCQFTTYGVLCLNRSCHHCNGGGIKNCTATQEGTCSRLTLALCAGGRARSYGRAVTYSYNVWHNRLLTRLYFFWCQYECYISTYERHALVHRTATMKVSALQGWRNWRAWGHFLLGKLHRAHTF